MAAQLTQLSFHRPEQPAVLLASLHALPLPENHRHAFLERVCAHLLSQRGMVN